MRDQHQNVVQAFVRGIGMRRDRPGSSYAWAISRTRKKGIEMIDGLSKAEAEWSAIVHVLEVLPPGAQVQIGCDCPRVAWQFNEDGRVPSRKIMRCRARARLIIRQRQLQVSVRWLPREENLAASRKPRRRSVTSRC